MTRSTARHLAIQLCFAAAASGQSPEELSASFFSEEHFSTLAGLDELYAEAPTGKSLDYILHLSGLVAEKKEELEAEGIHVDLDSARRTVEAQQEIMDRFTEKYGADYAAKVVAVPGYSEHHTGLALDLYLNVDGKDIIENEDLVQYPEIWAKIHDKLAAHGFILRYLEGKEQITGYAYEPWHIRYIQDKEKAKEIMDTGVTLEGYLGAVNETDVTVDLGKSAVYSEEELKEMAVLIKCQFAAWKDCELHSIRYAGDEAVSEENLKWINSMSETAEYVKVAEFLMDFHSPKVSENAFESDTEYRDYQWWLGCDQEGSWEIVSWGY